MSDLREALDDPMGTADDYYNEHAVVAKDYFYTILAAARRFLALTETGQQVEWCEVHSVVPGPWHRGNVEEGGEPCRIITAYVIPADYLTEEEI